MFSGSASTVQSHPPCCVIVEGFGRPRREARKKRVFIYETYVCWAKTLIDTTQLLRVALVSLKLTLRIVMQDALN